MLLEDIVTAWFVHANRTKDMFTNALEKQIIEEQLIGSGQKQEKKLFKTRIEQNSCQHFALEVNGN